jgi:hypothetical protein
MQTITRTEEVKLLEESDVENWLENEYPRGVDLIYIDYRDVLSADDIQEVIKNGYLENDMWMNDAQYDSIYELKNRCEEELEGEMSEEAEEVFKEWCFEHDTSNPLKDLLKNSGSHLFFVETEDYSEENTDTETVQRQIKEFSKKYAKNEEQAKEIRYVMNEQFYASPVSFYFYADVEDVYETVQNAKDDEYITINGAYFSTIDRVQGSNWLGNEGCFKIAVTKKQFIDTVFLDKAKGNGYSWDEIAGQTGYDEASVYSGEVKADTTIINAKVSDDILRERRLQENWDKTKKCTFGDMKWERHTGEKAYSNNYPCGNKCEDCGTFWID